ncbi:MAG: DUF3369 domain-containing protein [Nevskia sp.]|nr:DUF3369 domain-containing protein [Nevskia sp.]
MMPTTPLADGLEFAPERVAPAVGENWKILIADDEPDVHYITELTLRGEIFHGRPLQFLHAYSGKEAVEMLRRDAGIALVLLDVVMETEHAGLDAVQAIRNVLGNHRTRIVLRTGHPGQAPEQEVVRCYDINDYKEKTELTSKKMFTLVHTSLGHYRKLTALEENKAGLETVINTSATIFELRSLQQFARGVLQQLSALLYTKADALIVHAEGLAASRSRDSAPRVIAAIGRFAEAEGKELSAVPDVPARSMVAEALSKRRSILNERSFAGYFGGSSGTEHVVYVTSDMPIDAPDQRLLSLFCRNVTIAFENLSLHSRISDSQRQIILMLTQAIEERSRETGNHVRRVVAYCALMGRLYGLSNKDLEILPLASALHDVGKIGIPDAILHKNGRLTPEERTIMESHAMRGQDLLQSHSGEIMQAGATIAGQHHEHWDGTGYPLRLRGTDSHVYARIAGLMDVFDALTTRRCYKDPWTIADAMDYINKQKNLQFDPDLVELMLGNMSQFLDILRTYPDQDPPL